MFRYFAASLFLCCAIFSTAALGSDEATDAPRKSQAQGKRNMRRGGGQMRFDPMMMLAFQVKDELKAYNENKTDENYKKLEAAVKNAADKMSEKFLQKAKNGDLKMPQRAPRKGGKGKGGKGGKSPSHFITLSK